MPAIRVGRNDLNKECLLLHDIKKCYMPISKAANSSIKQACLRNNISNEFVTKDVLARDYPDYQKITVVRNPFDRLVSVFHFFTQRQPQYFDSMVESIKLSDFESFIRAIHDEPDEIANCHYRSQFNLLSHDGEFLPDVVVKLEEIEQVKNYLPVKDLKVYDRTTSKHEHYSTYYTPKLVRLVDNRFKKDLEFFKYAYVSEQEDRKDY